MSNTPRGEDVDVDVGVGEGRDLGKVTLSISSLRDELSELNGQKVALDAKEKALQDELRGVADELKKLNAKWLSLRYKLDVALLREHIKKTKVCLSTNVDLEVLKKEDDTLYSIWNNNVLPGNAFLFYHDTRTEFELLIMGKGGYLYQVLWNLSDFPDSNLSNELSLLVILKDDLRFTVTRGNASLNTVRAVKKLQCIAFARRSLEEDEQTSVNVDQELIALGLV